MSYLGSTPASAVLTSEDIAAGAVTLNDISFTDVPTNMDITGVIDKNTMRLAEGVTITGDVTISDDLVLAKLSDDGVGITMTTDATTRTITGSGSIESTTIAQTHSPSLTGMTGTVGSAVTLPTGSMLQVVHTLTHTQASQSITTSDTQVGLLTKTITPKMLKLCEENNCTLVYIYPDESDEIVDKKIKETVDSALAPAT